MIKQFSGGKVKRGKINIFPLYFLLAAILFGLGGCQTSIPEQDQLITEAETRVDTQLILNNAILEQSNKRENTVWKIKADSIIYSEDQKIATLEKVVGNLLQDDKIIFQISAKTGTVKDNGNIIVLDRDIIAKDPRNEGIIKSNTVEWRPQENLLLINDGLKGIHPNLNVTAERGKYYTNLEQLELDVNVIATMDRPPLQLTSDRLTWDIAQNTIVSPGKVKIVRYDGQDRVTDRLVSDRAQVNLISQVATLKGNIELVSLQPKLQAATEFLTWNYQQRLGNTNKPIQIVDRDRQITLTGNQGQIDLDRQQATLEAGVRAVNQQKSSELYARQLLWQIDTKKLEATGNIIYEQADPQARLTGEKAVGTLGNNNIVVTSDGKKQVTTIIEK